METVLSNALKHQGMLKLNIFNERQKYCIILVQDFHQAQEALQIRNRYKYQCLIFSEILSFDLLQNNANESKKNRLDLEKANQYLFET